MWFEAKDPEIHKQIQEYINKWEEIPLKLNAMTEVYLTEKWINNLKNGYIETKLDALVEWFDNFLKEREVVNNNIRTHEEWTVRELREKLSKCTNEELEYILENSEGELYNQSYRILESRKNSWNRPKLNSDRNNQYTRETLNSYKEWEVFELWYNTEYGQTREIYIKENDGYFRVIEKDWKYVKTEEKITEQQMVEKMRWRKTFKSEIKLSSNIEQTNNSESILENLKSANIEDYIIIESDWKIKFKPEYIGKGEKYVQIQWNKYQIFENWKWNWVWVMLWSRESASVNWMVINWMKSRWEYDMQIWNFKNWKLEWEWIRISRWTREEWIFKDGKLEWKWKKYDNNQLVYEWEFKDGMYNWQWKYTWADWRRYEWEFKNWMLDWKWKQFNKDWELVFEWEFKDWSRLNKPSEVSNKRVNTERREMKEVQRDSDVIAIWDLHGEYAALKWNMEFAWLAKEVSWHLEWTWWNKRVVFQWDILADRWTDWLRIIQEIHKLREQARKQWWDIDIIVWNHDDFMIAFLLWWKVSRFAMNGDASALDIAMNGSQWKWLTELLDFIWIKKIWEFDDFLSLSRKNNEILNAMRSSPEWRMILEEICNMKLVSQVDDVLYCHTNPTKKMLEYLTRWNIQENINSLNQKYQWFLRKALLWEWNWAITIEEFNNISDIFLNTWNRYTWLNDQYALLLKDNWINMISHGHSWWSNNYWYTNNQLEIWGVKVVDTDYSYRKWWRTWWQHSVSVIKKEWWVNYMWDNVAYANLDYPIGTEVYVKRTAWWESRARVESYNPTTKEYRVTWEEWWRIASLSR